MGWAVLGAVVPVVVIAQAVPEPYGQFAQYGVAGLFGFLLYRRYESELARERVARERAEQQADTLAERAISDLVPLVAEAARTMVPALERNSAEASRLAATLERLAAEVQRVGQRVEKLEQG